MLRYRRGMTAGRQFGDPQFGAGFRVEGAESAIVCSSDEHEPTGSRNTDAEAARDGFQSDVTKLGERLVDAENGCPALDRLVPGRRHTWPQRK